MLNVLKAKIATAAELEQLERERPAPVPELNIDGGIGEAVNAEISAQKQARIRYLRERLEAGRERARSAFLERSFER